ncbi:MAG: hypothetical protein HUU01_07360, partial [Saprospiraceae bacterium]|nr:hypothetical protein [Saprospiraceae bacterium]
AVDAKLDDKKAEKKGGWQKVFEQHLLKNSGFQQVGEFMEFEVLREVKFPKDTEIPFDEGQLQKMLAHGYEVYQRPDQSYVAIAKAGVPYKLPMTYRLPVSVVGHLPGQEKFAFAQFGITNDKDLSSRAHGAKMAKMFTAQILMSMGGYSPKELQKEFGPQNMFVGVGTGLGDLLPFNDMTVLPLNMQDDIANYLMAALLPDATTGQIATEQLGAEGMALAVIAACSTGNANIVMAVKELFGRYYMATRDGGEVNWAEVFKKLWIAGGVDYALTYNSVFGFNALGALLRDDWRRAHELAVDAGSRPDEKERGNFVPGVGGGGQALSAVGHAKATGKPVYGMVIGEAFRTDGDKSGKAREGYGPGQVGALFEAWESARKYVTEHTQSEAQVQARLKAALKKAGIETDILNPKMVLGDMGLRKPSQQQAFVASLKEAFNVDIIRWSLEHLPAYLSRDPDIKHSYVKKCMYAIAAQPEPEASIALRELQESEDLTISKLASDQLARMAGK